MTPEDNLRLYESDVNAEENIRKAISEAYQNLRPEIELVQDYENQQFPSFYDAFHGYGAGTTATDLTPSTLLQNAWTNVGQKSASANTARGVLDVRKAGMEDLIKTGINQWGLGYTGAQNQYNRWWNAEQAAEAKRQFEEQMALERQKLARMGSGADGTPGIVIPTPNQGGTPDLTTAYQNYLRGIYQSGGKIDPATGKTIVGMSLPGGSDMLWTVATPENKATPSTLSGYTSAQPSAANTGNAYLDAAINKIKGIR